MALMLMAGGVFLARVIRPVLTDLEDLATVIVPCNIEIPRMGYI